MRHNEVNLCGYVDNPPRVVINEQTGEPEYAMGRIFTIRGVRRFSKKSDSIRYDSPMIYTHNPELCKDILKWKHGDIVEVKGSLVTKEIKKTSACEHCGAKNAVAGTMTYVSPIFVNVRETPPSKTQAFKRLQQLCEISNFATIIGVVCREPQFFKKGKTFITSYQLAVRRKFRIKEDAEDARTDFPWVKSYGPIGENDALSLKKGSYIFIDGWIQARTFKRTKTCEACGQDYQWFDSSQEIIPFATEYIKNYVTAEEIDDERKKKINESIAMVFGAHDNEEEKIDQNAFLSDSDKETAMNALDQIETENKSNVAKNDETDDNDEDEKVDASTVDISKF